MAKRKERPKITAKLVFPETNNSPQAILLEEAKKSSGEIKVEILSQEGKTIIADISGRTPLAVGIFVAALSAKGGIEAEPIKDNFPEPKGKLSGIQIFRYHGCTV